MNVFSFFVFLFCLEKVQAEINRGTCIVLGANSFGEQPATHNTLVNVEQWQEYPTPISSLSGKSRLEGGPSQWPGAADDHDEAAKEHHDLQEDDVSYFIDNFFQLQWLIGGFFLSNLITRFLHTGLEFHTLL
jgi:hypothetical protein